MFLSVNTFLISRMVAVLSVIPTSSNSYLDVEFKNLIILEAYVEISPSFSLPCIIVFVAFSISSFWSNMIWIEGQISFIESSMFIQLVSLAWDKVWWIEVSLSTFCNFYNSLYDFFISITQASSAWSSSIGSAKSQSPLTRVTCFLMSLLLVQHS